MADLDFKNINNVFDELTEQYKKEKNLQYLYMTIDLWKSQIPSNLLGYHYSKLENGYKNLHLQLDKIIKTMEEKDNGKTEN